MQLEFSRPIQLEGYAIKTAGEGVDPKSWTLFIDRIETKTGQKYFTDISDETNPNGPILKQIYLSYKF